MSAGKNILPALYAYYIPVIQEVANECGYAVAVHGSMARDLDLIAVPWVDNAETAQCLVDTICTALQAFQTTADEFSDKPHGRKSCNIQFGSGPRIDLAVVPFIEGLCYE